MAGEDLDPVRQLEQAAERVEEASAPSVRADREIRSSRVADEERVAREDEPGLVGARAVDDREAACAPGGVRACGSRAGRPAPSSSSRPSVSASCGVLGLGGRVDRDRDAVLERQPAVPGEVIGVRVGLDDADDLDSVLRRLREHRLDRVRRGSTIAATPASSSPTRYDAHPRSSSRNCWKSTANDASRRSGGGEPEKHGDRRREREGDAGDHCQPGELLRGLRPPSGPGDDGDGAVHLDRLAVGEDRPQDEQQLSRRYGRADAHADAPERFRAGDPLAGCWRERRRPRLRPRAGPAALRREAAGARS